MSFIEHIKKVLQLVLGGDNTMHIAYGPEPLQFGELYLPQARNNDDLHPVVVLIHGGFWRTPYDLSLMEGLARDLAHRGIAAWNIEYRRIGDTGGGWPGTMQDAARATDYLSTLAPLHHLDTQRAVTVGHSAGGHLALWLAARPHIMEGELKTPSPFALTGAVSLAGAVDLEQVAQLHLGNDAAVELLEGTLEEVPERYAAASPVALLPLGVPQVLIHGTRDDRVPIEVSQSYARKAKEAGDSVTLIELPNVDHFVVIDPTSKAWATTVIAIQNLLQGTQK